MAVSSLLRPPCFGHETPSSDRNCSWCGYLKACHGVAHGVADWDGVKKGAGVLITDTAASDGSTASYYELPPGATELQDLISYRNMNAQMGELGRAWYRYGQCPHSPKMRELKKMRFYIDAEIARLEKYAE